MSNLYKPEFDDFMQVVEMGAKKYDADGWLEPDGAKTSLKDMHASMFRHLASSSAGVRLDDESSLDHLLHLATRALMLYTRLQRGIINPADSLNTLGYQAKSGQWVDAIDGGLK